MHLNQQAGGEIVSTKDKEIIYQRSPDQISANIDDDEVVLHMTDGVYYSLNRTGRETWQLLEEPKTLDAIVDRLMETFEVDRSFCLESVRALLEDMEAAKLVIRQAGK
jgi:hypothetical protein